MKKISFDSSANQFFLKEATVSMGEGLFDFGLPERLGFTLPAFCFIIPKQRRSFPTEIKLK